MVSTSLVVVLAAVAAVRAMEQPLARVVFGSCNNQAEKQPLWPAIAAQKPDLFVWLGDNIYGDYRVVDASSFLPPFPLFRDAPPAMLAEKYAKQLAQPEYAALRASTPIIGTWDDHDYGRNDGSKVYPFRKESQALFLDFLNEPKDSPRRQQEGVYASYTYGSGDRAVKFILLDVRYHRDLYGTPDGDFLGPDQWAWLEAELTSSTAAFNFIGSGIQALPDDRWYGAENWGRLPSARQRLLNLVLTSPAKGVVLLSGDVHFAEVNQVVCGAATLTEVTSSGMTHAWQYVNTRLKLFPTWIFTLGNLMLPWHYRVEPSKYFAGLNFGSIAFDWQVSPPIAMLAVHNADGHVKLTQRVASAPLPASSASDCVAPHAVHPVTYMLQCVALCVTVVSLVLSLPANLVLALILLKRAVSRPVVAAKKAE
ncbi:hypothetical protein SPRG_07545 [Saprolegnia parasitica CBS 223.65]|uniref:PhoD-like phosphatase metallophosphatase domain-containing protein n=1 Tax=Saprolegnia parasitica (strain CBS 223.65) TaxID=695850 RepID=A0A067CDQ5_SAPPC|nr:hypothetical protein SPRG_07545 [Saprolegnia parasitica CBS 223.65]KDO27295.1 hypothetical protein SPRG_07545 [Saprolegnia parasitica CBS 223.65]|eukprot:XP_012202069.1 hypothetical protein SPRG_07545 [Saprolegnia parasitica CBS 223.65]